MLGALTPRPAWARNRYLTCTLREMQSAIARASRLPDDLLRLKIRILERTYMLWPWRIPGRDRKRGESCSQNNLLCLPTKDAVQPPIDGLRQERKCSLHASVEAFQRLLSTVRCCRCLPRLERPMAESPTANQLLGSCWESKYVNIHNSRRKNTKWQDTRQSRDCIIEAWNGVQPASLRPQCA